MNEDEQLVAVAAFPSTGSGEVRAALLANLSRAYMRTGQPVKSIEAADLALDLAEHLGLDRIVAETFNNKGSSLGYIGRRRESAALLLAAVDVAHEGGFVAAEIRALSNSGASSDDQRKARVAYQAAHDLALRVGNRNLARWARESARFASFASAQDWDAAMAGAVDDELDEQGGLDEVRRVSVSALIESARGDSTDASMARLEALENQVSDPYAKAAVHVLRSHRAFHRSDYATAMAEATTAADAYPDLSAYFIQNALHSALWAHDLPAVRDVAARLDADLTTGPNIEGFRLAAHAAIAALEGRMDEAIVGYREALSRHRSVGADYDLATAALDFVAIVGGDHPATREAAAEARTIFERVRAQPYLALLDAAMSAPERSAPAAGARSGSVVSSPAVTG